jgi:putative addiction module component (TIGR02574 family)
MSLSELPQLFSLSSDQKIELADELLLSAYASQLVDEISQEEKVLLDSRWDRFLQDPESSLTLEEFQEKVNALRA